MDQVQQQQWEAFRGEEFLDQHDLDDFHNLPLQLSIHDSCRDAYLKTATSSADNRHLKVSASIQPVLTLCLDQCSVETELTLAVRDGRADLVRRLLEGGASPLDTNSRDESPLLLAVRGGSYEISHTLLAYGAWAELPNPSRTWTSMHEAARRGHADVLTLLLRRGGGCVDQRDATGATPLAVAAEHGQLHAAEILLHCGSRVNAQTCSGESILMGGAGSGSSALVRLLLEHGAQPDLASSTGHLPVHRAAARGHLSILELLLPLTSRKALKESGQSPLHCAAEGGHGQCLRLLLSRGLDVNHQLSAGTAAGYCDLRRSALYFAVSNGDPDCTRLLLAAGAKTELDPLRCLLVAVRSGRRDLVRLLLAAGADPNLHFRPVSNSRFPTALQYCLKDEAMMRLLLAAGYRAQDCFQCGHQQGVLENQGEGPISFCDFVSLGCVVHLAGKVVRILLDYVGHVSLCPDLRLVLEKQQEWPHIQAVLSSPRSLAHLCRLEIRRRVTLKRLKRSEIIGSQVLPPGLKCFLLYQELDLIGSV